MDGVLVVGLDLDSGVHLGGGGAANHEGNGDALALEAAGHVDHLVEGGGNKAGEAEHVGLVLLDGSNDVLAGHHDA